MRWGVQVCPRFRGCARPRCRPRQGTRATRRVASATNKKTTQAFRAYVWKQQRQLQAKSPCRTRQSKRLRGNRATRSFERGAPPLPPSPLPLSLSHSLDSGSVRHTSRPREKGFFREACAGNAALARPPIHWNTIDGGARYGPISISIKGGAHVPPPRKCPPHKRSGREDARSLRINDARGKRWIFSLLGRLSLCSIIPRV